KEAAGFAYLDATTGELFATDLAPPAVLDELVRAAPREILVAKSDLEKLGPLATRYRAAWTASAIPAIAAARAELASIPIEWQCRAAGRAFELSELAVRAAAAVVAYARATQPTGTLPISRLHAYEPEDAVVLDEAAIANLELVQTIIGAKR